MVVMGGGKQFWAAVLKDLKDFKDLKVFKVRRPELLARAKKTRSTKKERPLRAALLNEL